MSVHGPQVWAAFHPSEATVLEVMETDFLRLSLSYPEDEMPVFERWMRILEFLPQIHGKHLYDNLTPLFEDVYRNGTGNVVGATIDFLLLRYRFFDMLLANGVGRTHTNIFEIEATHAWSGKLIDRLVDTDPSHFKKGTYVPARTATKTKHRWIQ